MIFVVPILVLLVTAAAIFWAVKQDKWEVTETRWLGHDLEIMIRTRKGERVARGSCTVFHWYPSGVRCSTFWEGRLNTIWQVAKWRRQNEERGSN
jgi:nitrogen fixation-related uncharacterized protein